MLRPQETTWRSATEKRNVSGGAYPRDGKQYETKGDGKSDDTTAFDIVLRAVSDRGTCFVSAPG
jgi:hypothetical protein